MPEKIDPISSESEQNSREDQWEAVRKAREIVPEIVTQVPLAAPEYSGTSANKLGELAPIEFASDNTPVRNLSPANREVEHLTPEEESFVNEQFEILKEYLTPENLEVVVDADGDGVPDSFDQKIETRAETAKKFLERLIELRKRCLEKGTNPGKMFRAILGKSSLLDNNQIANLLGNTKVKGAGDLLSSNEDADSNGLGIPGVNKAMSDQ